MKKVLVSDIDGVLAELYTGLNNFYNKAYGTSFKLTDYIHYDLEKVWGIDKEKAVEIVVDFYLSPDFKKIKPIGFSRKAIKCLSEKYNIILITSRPNFMRERTEKWVYEHYPDTKKIFFTGDYDKKSIKMSKLDICLKENAKIIIDDHPLIVQECAEHGLVSFLFGRGNNLEEKIEKTNGIVPVNNWKEILNYLNINYLETKR